MAIVDVNLVVRDLDRSAAFYRGLGWTFRPVTMPGEDVIRAWLTTDGPAPVSLHTTDFAAWWDPSEPGVVAGSATIDLGLESVGALDAFARRAQSLGGVIVALPRDMDWGQRYAIVADPDGYRWGLKAELG